MALVIAPKAPGKGDVRWNVNARRQSTDPDSIGANAEVKASSTDTDAMATATRPAQTTPSRLITMKSRTMAQASPVTGIPGRNHCLIADAERSAVRPHVGTQPHQYDTPVRLPSTGAYGRKASPQVAAMPPTRSGHIRINSVHPGKAAQLRISPSTSSGMAAVP